MEEESNSCCVTCSSFSNVFFALRLPDLPQVQIHRVRPKQAAQAGRQEGIGEVQVQVQVQAEEVTLPFALCCSPAEFRVEFLSVATGRKVCTLSAAFEGRWCR